MANNIAITQAQVNELEALASNITGDRLGFYLRLYEITGVKQALMQAEITTYSGAIGHLAILANANAKLTNLGIYPTPDRGGVTCNI